MVIPTWNEEKESPAPATARETGRVPEAVEVIVVDAGSSDATRALAERAGHKVLTAPRSRAAASCRRGRSRRAGT